ncbi:hypothetical protein CQW23_12157 [Capsicum baccatum]|uniref:Ubiquitin-like protease family profile domain-containing protein n=1 Tax=Capsicum baccatum TaxID=33114 RepID=A0A2G2WRY4_CAPBA|nr:hypothetical protein CQW23_12157 [Capsicum baccatum]
MYENKDKMDEVWINYCGMPVCFGWEEFSIVTGLKYYPPFPSQVIPTLTQKKVPRTPQKVKVKSSDRDDLVSIVGPSFKNKNLIEALKGKGLSKRHKQSLCLVWFVHNVLWARDVNNNISLGLIRISEDLEVFNSYPWGNESFKMTIEYFSTPLTPKIVNLYGFPWAFRIVHPWLVPTNRELKMPFFLTLQSVQTLSDPKVVDGIKMKLFGETTIARKIILEGGANDAPLTVFETTSHYDYDHNGCIDFSPDFAASSECSLCKCQHCKAKHDGVINAINALTTFVKEMTSKRGVIPSKRISYPDTPLEIKTAKRRRKNTSKASSIIKKSKIAMPLSLSCIDVQCARATEEQHELKKMDVTTTAEEHNMTVDNSLTASKDEEKVKPNGLPMAVKASCQQPKVSRNKKCLINIIKGFSISSGLPWHLVDEVYILINCGDEFHWVLAVVILKERRIRVYDSMWRRRHSGPSYAIQKMAKILPTYLDMSGFLDQKVRTDWSTIEAYLDKMANPFDVQYVDGIAQQTIGSLGCSPFLATYVEYLSDGLQVPNEGLDTGLLCKIYAALLWKYGEAKAQKPYATDVKDP